jgi:ABC-type antimicrobial peptide transport system permease subunit
MALGAGRRQILRMIVREGMALAVCGIAMGCAGAFGLSRFLAAMLFGVSATSSTVYGATAATLAAIAVVASLTPAWRATTIAPTVALRND